MEGGRQGGTWQPPPPHTRPRRSPRRLPGPAPPAGGGGTHRALPPCPVLPAGSCTHCWCTSTSTRAYPHIYVHNHLYCIYICMYVYTLGVYTLQRGAGAGGGLPVAVRPSSSSLQLSQPRSKGALDQAGAVTAGPSCPRAAPAAHGSSRNKPGGPLGSRGLGIRERGHSSASSHQPHLAQQQSLPVTSRCIFNSREKKKVCIKNAGGIAIILGLTQSMGISAQHRLCCVPLAAPRARAGLQGEKFQGCLNRFSPPDAFANH